MPMHRLKRTKPEDALESAVEGEKRLGLTAKTMKAAENFSRGDKWWNRGYYIDRMGFAFQKAAEIAFLNGVRWERRRRKRDGY